MKAGQFFRKVGPKSHFSQRVSPKRRGSVTIIMAGGTTFLMACAAMAVDYGLLVADANRLQRACDAAALAGAAQLKVTGDDSYDTYNARQEAVRVARLNGITLDSGSVSFSDNNSKVRVPANTVRAFFFGKVIGQNSGAITRSSVAAVAPGKNLTTGGGRLRVAPIGISWETYNAYKNDRQHSHDLELIRQNKDVFGLDDLVLFDLRTDPNSKSGAHMQNQLTGEEIRDANLGDFDTTLNAAQPSEQNHFTNGLDELFDRSQNAPWYDNDHAHDGFRYNDILNGTSPRDNPRVVYLIITPGTYEPSNGTFDTQIQGFAPVYIENYEQKTIAGQRVLRMQVRFLPAASASDDGTTPSPGSGFTGVRVVSLVG